jgi:hypothetical protein
VNIGGGNNYLRGDGSLTVTKSNGKLQLTVGADARAKLSIPGFRAVGNVTGSLTVTIAPNGALAYAADLLFDAEIEYWNPLADNGQGDWRKLGSAKKRFSVSGGTTLKFEALGHTFSLGLPG